jgi:hypothetical protein
MAYGNLGGTSIGALLRMIQEEKATQPPIPPSAEVGSPMRGVIQQPIQLPESPGTTHVVSVKPEATPSPSNQPMASPARALGGPGLNPPPVPTPVPTPARPQQNTPATANLAKSSTPSVAKVSAPSIATKIAPSTTYGPAVPNGFQYAPSSRMGQSSVGTPLPTPTPKGGPSGSPIDPFLRSIWDKFFKGTGGKAYA